MGLRKFFKQFKTEVARQDFDEKVQRIGYDNALKERAINKMIKFSKSRSEADEIVELFREYGFMSDTSDAFQEVIASIDILSNLKRDSSLQASVFYGISAFEVNELLEDSVRLTEYLLSRVYDK